MNEDTSQAAWAQIENEMHRQIAESFPGEFITPVYGASRYCVSIDGSVFSFTSGRPKKLTPSKRGAYLGFSLSGDCGNQLYKYLHRVVLESWDRPAVSGEQCRHINGDRFDNRLTNLQWGTASENAMDKAAHGTAGNGERNPMAELSEQDVLRMREIRSISGVPYKSIAKYFGVSAMTAYRAITKQSWSHI